MDSKKYTYILLIIGIICISASAIYRNQKSDDSPNKTSGLRKVTITPPQSGLYKPIKVALSEEDIKEIPIYKESP